ncbi:hypothetical protein HV417_04375 [Bacillus sporothermodurans]|uniref:hypothetical protein n=1 Tax=Heyndrickxia sporothermodurans TaxID=46224 RepID=UPI00192C853C|nr:hypothetical protein [Heyndrickxia sporothermodurans]MBL5872790.1 hypothetical protein [Heyndrickxia sporothermodurans]
MKNFIMISISLILLISDCSQTSSKGSKDFIEIGDKSVSKIEVIDGRNGNRHTITEKDKIQHFIQLLNEKEYKEMENHEKTKGYIYKAVLSSNNKEFNITFLDNEIKINDTYYSLNNPLGKKIYQV